MNTLSARRQKSPRRMRGVVLIEVLIAALIFSLGVLGLVGVSALSTTTQTEARYRTDASSLANDLAQRIWLNVNRAGTRAQLQTSLAAFAYNESETGENTCRFTGAGGNTVVQNWVAANWGTTLDNTAASMHVLPGTAADMLSVQVGTGPTDYNFVRVVVCWLTPGETVPRRHVVDTWVN